MIHDTAIVSSKAKIGKNVQIGPFSIIEDDVEIGDNCIIKASVRIADGARLAENVQIYDGAIIGTIPQDLKFAGEKTYVKIGKNSVIREYATLNRGTDYRFETVIGENCFIMAYAHVAHDCLIGDNCILVNNASLAGHVELGKFVTIGGLTPVHQFVKIGDHSFIGGGYRVNKDVPPFIKAQGEPLRFVGLNSIGLQRRGFSKDEIETLNKAYKVLYRSGLNISQAVTRLKEEFGNNPFVINITNFVENSDRGIIKYNKK